jgi:uncharacterized protein
VSDDQIGYPQLVQEALRQVVRAALAKCSGEAGPPGEHHFYVTFRTQAPDVVLSERLRQEYEREMTIVLQHQFWDLEVGEANFSVGLSFHRIPERITVPYAAITRFTDPSVPFGLQFEVKEPVHLEQTDSIATPTPAAAEPSKADDASTEEDASEEVGGKVLELDHFRNRG